MNHADKLKKLKEFNNESDFRMFLIDLFKKIGFLGVIHTHRYGAPEFGKDIIGTLNHSLDGNEIYAFVVKHGKITGGTNEIETIKNQIKQAFEYPYVGVSGAKTKINKVKVVTNDHFSNGAITAIATSPELAAYPNIEFWYVEPLIELIDKHFSDFWLPGDMFFKEYTKSVIDNIKEEFKLKDLSIAKIEDKKIKKLLDIFISPYLTEATMESKVEEGKEGEKILIRKKVSVNSILESQSNVVISGDPGSGKTKLINNLACTILDSKELIDTKVLPIILKGKDFKNANFIIEDAVHNNIEQFCEATCKDINIDEYKQILFVDEIDILTKDEKILLVNNLTAYTKDTHRFILAQRKNDNLDLKSEDDNIRAIRINNFNISQVESFINKYFEGSDRGEKFIQILRESNLLSKLPTTPLTITLISLLHDENGHEIPATLTDIYEDFTHILLGKLAIKNRTDLLIINIKKRIFSFLALKLLDSRKFEISFDEFELTVNSFLEKKGYQIQSKDELIDIINNSGVLYIDQLNNVGFKQQAFIEYFASVEIYHHSRHTHYKKLLQNFNDVTWQNTAIFFAGKSKDFPEMINDVIESMPNNELRDWFINSGGLGYLSQALYMTDKDERKKLIIKALDNMVLAFNSIKELTKEETFQYKDLPLPLIAAMINIWFIENFKSITLNVPLLEVFEDLCLEYKEPDINDFVGDFKLFLVASTLMHKNIHDDTAFLKLIDRKSFVKNPVLMIAGDFYIDSHSIDKKNISPEIKKNLEKQIRHHIKAIKHIIREPAYRFDNDYSLLPKKDNSSEKSEDLTNED